MRERRRQRKEAKGVVSFIIHYCPERKKREKGEKHREEHMQRSSFHFSFVNVFGRQGDKKRQVEGAFKDDIIDFQICSFIIFKQLHMLTYRLHLQLPTNTHDGFVTTHYHRYIQLK